MIDVLEDIYDEFGYYHDKLLNFILKGKEGQEKIVATMKSLRENEPNEFGGVKISVVEDFSKGVNDLPLANVLKYRLEDGSFIAFRPSGTEPKFKVYLSIRGNTKAEAIDKYERIAEEIEVIMK
ncbi:hypothetical protein RJG79_02335 [Mycoplasmatota bacterium WC44]